MNFQHVGTGGIGIFYMSIIKAFYDLLAENYGKEGKTVVDYWILTHPHSDHVGAFLSIANDQSLVDNLTIKNVVYYFPKNKFKTTQNTAK